MADLLKRIDVGVDARRERIVATVQESVRISTDIAHVARVTGIPAAKIDVGRPGETNNHGPDENVRIDDLLDLVKIICALATDAGDQDQDAP